MNLPKIKIYIDEVIHSLLNGVWLTSVLSKNQVVKRPYKLPLLISLIYCFTCPITVRGQVGEITYSGAGFIENPANDGSVSGVINVSVSGTAFSNSSLSVGTDVDFGNIPDGLTPQIDVSLIGSQWTQQTVSGTDLWRDITYGNGVFVAVGETNTGNGVATSPDGVNWTQRVALDTRWNAVAYGNGIFVALGNGTDPPASGIMTSPDGITWTERPAPSVSFWNDIVYANNQFVAIALFSDVGEQVMTSPDGITWTSQAASNGSDWSAITYGNGLYVAVGIFGSNSVMTSPDGIIWTGRQAASVSGWNAVAYGNGTYVAYARSNSDRLMTSPDAINWTNTPSTDESAFWTDVIFVNDVFIAIKASGTSRVVTSPDGINWTEYLGAPDTAQWSGITSGNGLLVAVAGTRQIMSSSAASTATLTFTGNATNHEDIDDVIDITFDFSDSAFVNSNASSITNATGPASSNLGIDFNDETLGIDENHFNDLSLYPNPVLNSFVIKNPNEIQLTELVIYDITGKMVRKIDINNTQLEMIIDISSLSASIYMVKIKSESNLTMRRLIKE